MLDKSGSGWMVDGRRYKVEGTGRTVKGDSAGYLNKGYICPKAWASPDRLTHPDLPDHGYPEPEDPDYPLVLTSAKSRYYLHSSYRWLEKLRNKYPASGFNRP